MDGGDLGDDLQRLRSLVGAPLPAHFHERGQLFGHRFGDDWSQPAADLVVQMEGAGVLRVRAARSCQHFKHYNAKAVNVTREVITL